MGQSKDMAARRPAVSREGMRAPSQGPEPQALKCPLWRGLHSDPRLLFTCLGARWCQGRGSSGARPAHGCPATPTWVSW